MAVVARCMLCGKKIEVAEDHQDFPRLKDRPNPTFICDICKNRVRYESQELQKPSKPI